MTCPSEANHVSRPTRLDTRSVELNFVSPYLIKSLIVNKLSRKVNDGDSFGPRQAASFDYFTEPKNLSSG